MEESKYKALGYRWIVLLVYSIIQNKNAVAFKPIVQKCIIRIFN